MKKWRSHDAEASPGYAIRTLKFDVEQSEELSRAAFVLRRQQAAAYNWSMAELIEEGEPVPLMSGKDRPDALYKRLTAARADGMAYALLSVQRPGVRRAREAYVRWDSRLREYREREKNDSLNRADKRWKREPGRLFNRRKNERRRRAGALVYDVQPRRVDDFTVKLPGLPPLIARKKLPEQETIRSAQLVDVTQKVTRHASVEKRKYALRLQARVPTPDPKPAFDKPVGIDLGVAHAVTTSDGIHYDARTAADLDERADEARRSMSRKRSKKRKSRRHRKERRKLVRLTRKATNRRNDDYRRHAKDIAENHTFVGFEGLRVTNMTRSARGTAKKPGSGVSRKRGLNRSIHRAAWSLFLMYLLSACVMAGASC